MARQTLEPDMIRQFAHDLDDNGCGGRDLLTGVNAVSEDLLNERKAGLGRFQDRRCAVTILNRSRVNLDLQGTSIGVHQRMALAALDLLAGVVSARSAGFRGFDTLSVDDRRA